MILIALGANLPSPAGRPEATLKAALNWLEAAGALRVLALSRFYRSPSWPDPTLPEYLNAVARADSSLDPLQLLAQLHEAERAFGRVRGCEPANSPRPLDLDLLDFDGRILDDGVVLPHPRLHERAFVLLPLMDVAPGWRHPRLGTPVAGLVEALPRPLKVSAVPV